MKKFAPSPRSTSVPYKLWFHLGSAPSGLDGNKLHSETGKMACASGLPALTVKGP